MRKFLEPLIVMFLVLTGFVTMAYAAGPSTEPEPILDLAKPVLDAIMHGQWWLAASAGLILVVSALRKYAPVEGRFGWLGRAVASTPGVMGTTFALAFGGAVFNALLALGPAGVMSLAIAKTALWIGVAAIGAWKAVHTLATWAVSTNFYKTKVPASVQAIVAFVLGLLGSNAIAKAEAAGQKAVDAKPATGSTDGKFEQF